MAEVTDNVWTGSRVDYALAGDLLGEHVFRSGVAAVVAGIALIVSGCGSAPTSPQTNAAQEEKPPAKVTMTPAEGATVPPAGPFKVTVQDGTLTTVSLTNGEGKSVQGELSADKTTWQATEALGYDKAYTWSGAATGTNGTQTPLAGSFRTVKPGRTIGASTPLADDATYGIAMPIRLEFDAPVQDKASVEKALKVETSTPTEGAWAWLTDDSVHWRPKEYWKPGTKVNVTAKLYGVPFGSNAYGREDLTLRFTIGRALIATADTQTHRFIVHKDGQQLFDFPASYGLESDPRRVTRSGIHVVSEKHANFPMTNDTFGYRNEWVQWAVRISNNGEMVHEFEKSRASQGKENVSHGCVNLSRENAKKYFDEVLLGDPVEVKGSSVQLSPADNAYYDWALDWNTWTGKSAL